jgi:photosystem II stability/assembly factor-like uncharacterized protein
VNERAHRAAWLTTGRCILLWVAVAAIAGAARAAEAPRAAETARLADRSLLIALAMAGARLVGVGDRGIIVYSDDKGASWTQARAVPTQALLTGVCFFDSTHGVAVGHDLAALTTADAGRTWQLAHFDPAAQRPLLDVWCGAGGHAIAVGAYSTQLVSDDAGVHWSERKFAPTPPPPTPGAKDTGAALDTGSEGGFHLNRIVAASASRLYIAGEAGHLFRSDDAGFTWRQLSSPYEGSFFGVLPLNGDALLAFGLRGSLYRSENAGVSWQKLDSGTLAMLDGAARMGESGVVIVGLGGVVLTSPDGGHTYRLDQQADHADLSAVLVLGDERLVTAGVAGARTIPLTAGRASVKVQP